MLPCMNSANFIASEEERPIRAVGYFVSTDGGGAEASDHSTLHEGG